MEEEDLGPDLDGELAEDTNLTPEQFEHERSHSDVYVDMRRFGADGLLEDSSLSPAEFAERHAAANPSAPRETDQGASDIKLLRIAEEERAEDTQD
ncbi:MAG TPA: hypothetical protein VH063_03275 [Gaiellaceae bacterium]|nr:hypothetical protein [Gaiellaceae bacterium]